MRALLSRDRPTDRLTGQGLVDAGMPTAVLPGGTSRSTTAFAPMVLADRDTWQHDHPRSQPDVVANGDRVGSWWIEPMIWIDVVECAVDDHAMWSDQAAFPDCHAIHCRNGAAVIDQCSRADFQNTACTGAQLEPGDVGNQLDAIVDDDRTAGIDDRTASKADTMTDVTGAKIPTCSCDRDHIVEVAQPTSHACITFDVRLRTSTIRSAFDAAL